MRKEFTLLDRLFERLISKNLLTQDECADCVREAIDEIRLSPDPEIRKAEKFLQDMYGHSGHP